MRNNRNCAAAGRPKQSIRHLQRPRPARSIQHESNSRKSGLLDTAFHFYFGSINNYLRKFNYILKKCQQKAVALRCSLLVTMSRSCEVIGQRKPRHLSLIDVFLLYQQRFSLFCGEEQASATLTSSADIEIFKQYKYCANLF